MSKTINTTGITYLLSHVSWTLSDNEGSSNDGVQLEVIVSTLHKHACLGPPTNTRLVLVPGGTANTLHPSFFPSIAVKK